MLEIMMGSFAQRALSRSPGLAVVVELLGAGEQFGFMPAPRWLSGLLEREAKAAGLEPALLEAIANVSDFETAAALGGGYGVLCRPIAWGATRADCVSTADLASQDVNGPAWLALQTHVRTTAVQLAESRAGHPDGLSGALLEYCRAASFSSETAGRIAAAYVFLTVGRLVEGGGLGGLLEA